MKTPSRYILPFGVKKHALRIEIVMNLLFHRTTLIRTSYKLFEPLREYGVQSKDKEMEYLINIYILH